VLAVACALVIGSCEGRPPLAPSADDTTLGLTAFSVLSGSYNLTATATAPTAIALSWDDNSSQEAGFEIHRSTTGPTGAFTLYAVTAANVTSASDFSVPQSTLYCYRVRAFRNVSRKTTYAAFSNTACAKTPALPPSNVNATPASSSEIDISWTDNASTDDSFRVERAATSAGPWELAATTSSQTSYRDASRTADQQVCYRVIAVTADGDSGPSNVDCTTPPAGPTNLTAVAASQTIDLSWADNSAVEDGYEIEFSGDGVTFAFHTRLPANVTRFSFYPSISNTTYWFRVRAFNDGGFSNLSNVASATSTCAGSEYFCHNGVDDDCDGAVDFADPDCSTNCTPTEVECNNYADDDCDGLPDSADPDCPPPPCDYGCPPGMVCIADYCYYPWWDEAGDR
jgi:hypothetical protein